MGSPPSGPRRVALFCGGRGSATIIKALLRHAGTQLTLLLNGYDDGQSTGELRQFLPGMLGPSDFRKNLSLLVGLRPPERSALQRILDYRLAPRFSEAATDLRGLVSSDSKPQLPEELSTALRNLNSRRRLAVVAYLKKFLEYWDQRGKMPALHDCALGNLVFAGAYLASGKDFNATVETLTKLCRTRARLLNVSQGESRVLTALKADGALLHSEAEIVGPQSRSPILDLFLLPRELTHAEKKELATLPTAEKRQRLKSWEEPVGISPETDQAVRDADLIVYGPGTQFSSLFPTYRTQGLSPAILASRACAKVFIANLEWDHDIQGMRISELIDKALEFLGDPTNDTRVITHVLCNNRQLANRLALGWEGVSPGLYKHIHVIQREFADVDVPAVHCGNAVLKQLFELHQAGGSPKILQGSGRFRALSKFAKTSA